VVLTALGPASSASPRSRADSIASSSHNI
jgi:hypothetical protein